VGGPVPLLAFAAAVAPVLTARTLKVRSGAANTELARHDGVWDEQWQGAGGAAG
jgi:hypothetical protein